MKRIKWLYAFVMNFFDLWGRDYYGEPIDFGFAWELAKVKADLDDELSTWEPLEQYEAEQVAAEAQTITDWLGEG
jgi:hypothetical protein